MFCLVFTWLKSHRYLTELFFQHMRKADCPHRTAFLPSVIHRNHPVRAFRHIPASPEIDARVVFLLYHNHLCTSLQHFIGPSFLIQAVQALPVRDNGNKLQRRILFLFLQYNLCKILIHPFPEAAHKASIAVSSRTVNLTP